MQLSHLAMGAGFGLVGRFSGRLVIVVNGILAARFLGPEIFGIYSIGLVVLRIAEVAIPIGFDVGIVKYCAGIYDQNSKFFRGILGYSFSIVFVFSSFLSAFVYITAPWLAKDIFAKELLVYVFRFIAFCFPLAGIMILGTSAITITQDIRYAIAIQDVGQPLLATGLLLVFLSLGFGLSGVLLSHLVSYGIAAAVVLFFLRRLFSILFNHDIALIPPIKEYYAFSFVSFSTVLLSTLMLWVDRLLLAFYVAAYDVGIYQSASQLAVIFAVILSGLSRIFVPVFAGLKNEDNFQELRNAYRIGTKWAIYLGLPILIFLLLNSEDVLRVLYGHEYAAGANILLILLIGQFINLLTGPVGPLLVIGGYQNLTFLVSGLALLINTSLSLIFIPRFGAAGAATVASMSVGFLYFSLFLIARQKMKVRPFDSRYFKPIIAGGIAYVLGLVVKLSWAVSFVGLAIQFCIVIIVFLFILRVLKFEPEDIALFSIFKLSLMRVLRR